MCHYHYLKEDIDATEQDKLDFDFVQVTINFSFSQHFLQHKILRKKIQQHQQQIAVLFLITSCKWAIATYTPMHALTQIAIHT